ncbi:MAG: glycosyltransferase family 4 protein [Gammaproteobacteria bacterium]
MRVLLHDYTGHPFQADLARQLALLGHTVAHVSCDSFPAPKGLLTRREGDASSLEFRTLSMPGGRFGKYSYVRRWRQERAYGHLLTGLLRDWSPDVLLICNTPLDPLTTVARHCRRVGLPLVFWQQDIYSEAIKRYLGRRLGLAGRVLGQLYARKEAAVARQARAVIAISEHFRPILARWSVPASRVHVIANWAPLYPLPTPPGDANPWKRKHGFTGKRLLLYAGTLGLKHDPGKLLLLAGAVADLDDVLVVVVSAGAVAEQVARDAADQGLDNLRLLPFQPHEEVPLMQASAEVLLSVLEQGAGAFSVPSKVLSQLCAGRALLASMPLENDAARMIDEAGAGIVTAPRDHQGWLDAARTLLADPERSRGMGVAARRYAEQAFDSRSIARRFEDVLEQGRAGG